ncbi:MAG: hypothetical protein ACOVP7_10230 [Lacibacter sp.]
MNEKHFADKQPSVTHDCNEHKCPNCFQYRGCIHQSYPLITATINEAAVLLQTQNNTGEEEIQHRAA